MISEESTAHARASWEVNLHAFRQIMFLPMALASIEDRERPKCKAGLGGWTPGAGWTEIAPACAHAPARPEAKDKERATEEAQHRQFFAEAAYFHPSVRTLLYGSPGKDNSDVRLFRREVSGQKLTVLCGYGPWAGLPRLGADKPAAHAFEITLTIDRCDLYVWADPGVAVFLLEVSAGQSTPIKLFQKAGKQDAAKVTASVGGDGHFPIDDGDIVGISLAEALALQDSLRRVYAPFFSNPTGPLIFDSGLLPSAVTVGDRPFVFTEEAARETLSDMTERLATPVAPWWRYMLEGVSLDGVGDKEGAPRWQQIVDDRMPTMVFIAPSELRSISRGDLIRLCFADNPGIGDLPYDKGFLADFEQKHCYDRFRDQGTLYMASNYTFIGVAETRGAPYPGDKPFNFALDVLQEHTRRHYAQMFLLVQLQRAALLMFSRWMADAMGAAKGDFLGDRVATQLTAVHNAFAAYTHRIWFGNVSNQMQARELFDLMQRHSGARELFEEVSAECQTSAQTLDRIAQQRQQSSAMTLNALFALSAIVTTPLVIVQGIQLFGEPAWAIEPRFYSALVSVLFVATAFVVAAAARLQFEGKLWPIPWLFTAKSHKLDGGLMTAVRAFVAVCVAVAIGAGALAIWWPNLAQMLRP